ncbi:MAG: hydroxyacid dehydrogenase [Kiloniellaceae bacterium]
MKKVLIIQPIHEAGLNVLRREADLAYEVVTDLAGDHLKAKVKDADAIIVRTARLGAEAIEAARKLRIVSRHGVGYDNVDVAALTRRRIPLTVIGDVNAVTVAEHALYMMLTLARRGLGYDRAVRAGHFDIRETWATAELWRKKALILGLGRIGREVARRCRGFDMEVLVYDPYIPRQAVANAGLRRVEALRAGLGDADYVTLHLPLTEETRNLIGRAELAAMKPTAFLVNTARGGVVDEGALQWALRSGEIAGAGLDTFVDEPPKPDDPLLQLDNVVLSPHCASLTAECAARMAIAAAENVVRGLEGKPDARLVVNQAVL